jgi:hypothetical protein
VNRKLVAVRVVRAGGAEEGDARNWRPGTGESG